MGTLGDQAGEMLFHFDLRFEILSYLSILKLEVPIVFQRYQVLEHMPVSEECRGA